MIARPWSQMYDKRKRNRRIKSPNPQIRQLQNYDEEEKTGVNFYSNKLRRQRKHQSNANLFYQEAQQIPFYGMSNAYQNIISDFDSGNSRNDSQVRENESIKIYEETKRYLLSSNSSRMESPSSYAHRSAIPLRSKQKESFTSSLMSLSQKPSVK
jgi:hypothetical protein